MHFLLPLFRACVAASLSVVALSGAAAEPLDEIVVRADLLQRSRDELPASISVLEANDIRDRANQHFEELITSLPNLNWSGDGNRARYLQIRGVGELEQYQGAPNPSVGFLIDDIDFSGIGGIATLFDVERIEVLRGPQGSRYGANALGGLVYVQSADPRDAAPLLAEATAGSDGFRSVGLAAGGAAGQRHHLRLAIHRHESNGFRRNAFLGRDDTNGRRETTLRGRWHVEAGDRAELSFAALHIDIDDGYDAFAIDNSATTLADRPGRDAQRSRGAALRLAYDLPGPLHLDAIASWADSAIDFDFDADWGNPVAWAPVTYDFVSINDRRRRTLSQELRLRPDGDGRWLVGMYLQRLDDALETQNRGVYDDPASGFALSVDDRLGSDYRARTAALFGQADVPLGGRVTLAVGARVEHRRTRYRDTSTLALAPDETLAGGNVGLRFGLTDNVSAYARIAHGYKAGGFNLGEVPDGLRFFDDESLLGIEAGLRAAVADGRMIADVSVFHNRRNGQQVRTSFQLDPGDPASFGFATLNADGRSDGIEATLDWSMSDRWQTGITVGLLDARFAALAAPLDGLSGRDTAHAPSHTLSARLEWRHPGGWFALASVRAVDRFFFDVSHDRVSEPYELVDLRAGRNGDHWSWSVWARNLADRRYAVRGFFFGNEPPEFPPTLYTRFGDPRHYGVTLAWRY